MLAHIVAAIGLIIALLGVAVLVAPGVMRELVRKWHGPRAMYVAVGFRLLAGTFFILASEACAWPMAIGTVGVVMLVAGFVGMFIGRARVLAMTAWFLHRSDAMWRVWAPFAIAFGGFIVYAATTPW